MDAENLQIKDLGKLSLQELSSEEVILRIEELSQDEQYLSEPMSAREFHESLSEVLKKYAAQINGTEVYSRLQKVLVSLMWYALPALDKNTKAQILSNNLIFALKNKVEVLTNIDAYLYVFEYGVGPDMEERRILSRSLDQNQERLGSKPINLKAAGEVAPSVSNWVKDFTSYYNPASYKGESYELTHYLYSSPNVKSLTPVEKDVLARVISIYLHLRHPSYLPTIVGKPGDEPVTEPRPKMPTPQKPPIPAAVKPVQNLAAAPDKVGFKSEFEQKLAAAGVAHGASLSSLRARVVERTLAENQALAKKTPPLTAQEIKREVSTPELPEHKIVKPVSIPRVPVIPAKANAPIPVSPAKVVFTAPKISIGSINVVDDLKKLEVGNLREGDPVEQIRLIKNKIGSLAAAGNLLPFYAVQAFEQSPLFRAYLLHGSDRVSGAAGNADLTQAEFEAVADLRKELGHL